jgi:two-component system chemotaxis response regulator CheB
MKHSLRELDEEQAESPGSGADIARNVILIGASAGGIEAIGRILRELPSDLDASIAITLHRSPRHPSMLADVLGARSNIEVVEPASAQLFAPGRVYVAPADFHLVFGGGLVLLRHGPRENHARPSIDVMFRSGATNFGPRVIGVILTGNLADGVAGLKAIKRHGGLSLAQEPSEALAPSMPLHAVVYDDVDIIFRLSAAGEVLSKLVGQKGVNAALHTFGARRPSDEPSAPRA